MLLMLDSILPTEDPLSRLDRLRVQWIRIRKLGPRYLLEWAGKRAKWQMEQLEARFGSNSEPELAADEFHNVAIDQVLKAAKAAGVKIGPSARRCHATECGSTKVTCISFDRSSIVPTC